MDRETYRHGDLRRALVEAGLELARASGPDAVVLRKATRRAGVSPSAAYRHFATRDLLVHEVSLAAQARLAAAIEAAQREEAARLPAAPDPGRAARSLLRGVGAGYLRFAWTEPGWFRTAFWVHPDLSFAGAAPAAGPSGRTPFQLLEAALDAMADAGVLPPPARPGAEVLAWSTVHGLATLTVDGPLRTLDGAAREALAGRLLLMVERGI